MDFPKLNQFQAVEGSSFFLPFDNGQTLELKLDTVEARESQRPELEHFSLIFSGPDSFFIPQATYSMDHETLGPLLIFLVPLGKKDGRYAYQAVFYTKHSA